MTQRAYRWSGAGLLIVAALLLSLGFGAAGAAAQTGPSTSEVLTIPAGQTAQVQVRGFCLDFGKAFPTGAITAKELAKPELRAALNYAIQKGYVDSNPAQVEQAMWFLSDGTWHSASHALGQEIVDNSKTGQAPTDPSGGMTLFDALAKGGLGADVTFTPKTADAFYGDGTMTIRNTGTSDLQVYLPIGTVFPPATADQQRLIVYALQVTQAAPTATAAPTQTAAPTVAPTETAVAMATAMPVTTPDTTVGLPTTGNSDPTNNNWWLLMGGGLLSLIAGLAVLRRSTHGV